MPLRGTHPRKAATSKEASSASLVSLPCPPWEWRSNESPIRHRPGANAAAPSCAPGWRLPRECVRARAWGRRAKVVDGREGMDDEGQSGCGALKLESLSCARRHAAPTPGHRRMGPRSARLSDPYLAVCGMCRGAALRCHGNASRWGSAPSSHALRHWAHRHTTTDHDAGSSQDEMKSHRGPSAMPPSIYPETKTSKTFSETKWHDTHISPNKMVKADELHTAESRQGK